MMSHPAPKKIYLYDVINTDDVTSSEAEQNLSLGLSKVALIAQ